MASATALPQMWFAGVEEVGAESGGEQVVALAERERQHLVEHLLAWIDHAALAAKQEG